jgi:hypothetical protein
LVRDVEKRCAEYTCAVSLVGGAPLLLGTSPFPVEVYNDIDSTVAYLFECLQVSRKRSELGDMVRDYGDGIPATELLSMYRSVALAPTVRIAAWYACAALLLQARLDKLGKKKLFNRGKGDFEIFNRKVAKDLYLELERVDPLLPDLHGRLFRMQIEHYPIKKVVQIYDSPETVFLVDEAHDEDPEETHEALVDTQGTVISFAV